MKPGRNDPCVCGSGKKYKKCCQQKLEAGSVIQPVQQHAGAAVRKHIPAAITQAEFSQLIDLFNAGRHGELESRARLMLERHPDSGFTWKILGQALQRQGKDNLQALQRAAQYLPDDVEAHFNLAQALHAQGNYAQALGSTIQSLRIKELAANKSLFVSCVKQMQFGTGAAFVRANLARALTEPWGRPSELAEAVAMLIKLDPVIEECVILAIRALPGQLSAQDLFRQVDIAKVAGDKLLRAFIGATAVCDIELERLLTTCRQALLDAACAEESHAPGGNADILEFFSALARQCFINEYVFAQSREESQQAASLRDKLVAALEAGAVVPALWPVAVAAYFPLYSLPGAARLLDRQWPEALQALLAQQVSEPQQELLERAGIPRLTAIEDEVSLLVQSQYEENPYPRWISMAPPGNAMTIDAKIRQLFPSVAFRPIGNCPAPQVLVAGCGTGQHSIAAAQKFIGASTLAIDLSLSSLSYARRKTREMGVTAIEYAQADIMKLGTLERRFDVIESCGVLHHLADPWAGWKILLSLLRPGGFMRLGFYSELARREIVRTRAYIAEKGYGSSPEEIRRCRQDMMAADESAGFSRMFRITDFYSTSECRDLLFHVQEHRMTLTAIDAFLRENELAFLGFELNPNKIRLYKQRFPDDTAATDLGHWQTFENENPDTFIGMYNFWIQKLK
jgi:2-polyprenyl-3-methyl-5-hydroxy-6-metoxy-1,4-benzoquinol methylase